MCLYKSVKNPAHAEYNEKKSVFIGNISPVNTEEDAVSFIKSIKNSSPDASHHVYAYIIREGNIYRFSDDGEPSSTAGKPALAVLQKNGLTNTVIVITRYFGGIKLGAGGLVRAYSSCAALAVDAAGIAGYCKYVVIRLTFEYALYKKISDECIKYGANVCEPEFGENVEVTASVKESVLDGFIKNILDLSNGKLKFKKTSEQFGVY